MAIIIGDTTNLDNDLVIKNTEETLIVFTCLQ